MARTQIDLVAFNRGLVSRLALARVDLKRLALSAEEDTNWMPRALGSMMLRPGMGYIGEVPSAPRFVPFVYSNSDKAMIEFTDLLMRVWIDDTLITRPSVSTAVANGTFDTDLASWTDNDEAGATSAWVTGGYMGLTGNGSAFAIRDQTVTVAAADQGVEHALRVEVFRGPVIFQVGTSTSDDSYVRQTTLATGVHSLAFTPTGNFNIRFKSALKRQVLVESCEIESAGVMVVDSPYETADLDLIRASVESQSADVVFVGCQGYCQRRIERRAPRSWSLVQYLADDGPFFPDNTGPITISASAISGNVTLSASASLFRSTHGPSADNPGALFRVTSSGQNVSASITAQNTFTNPIRVTGVDNQRIFTIGGSGITASGSTVTLQRSLESESGPWTDIESYTTDQSKNYDDGLDNQIVWYRIGVKTGGYGGGTQSVSLSYPLGTTDGIVRITAYSSPTSVSAEVIEDLGATTATDVWAEGQWSDFRGWPTAGVLYEGRMVWAGKDKALLSITDAFDSFDEDFEGDAGPISRSIGSGPVDTINWILPLQRLLLGGEMAEHSCRSSALDEPLTPTNFNIKPASTQGSARVQAVKVDTRGVYVQRGGIRIFELDIDDRGVDYGSVDLTQLVPEIGKPAITRMAVQRQPDTRIHCVRSDGTAAVLVNDKRENVLAWVEVETDGEIVDVITMPADTGVDEDRVYYVVARDVDGTTIYCLEKWALESECTGGTLNKQADSFVTFTNSPASATVTGLTHLIGENVVVWYDGKCPEDADGLIKTYLVNGSGQITLDEAASTGVVGRAYRARFKSAKLGTALTAHKRIAELGLVLADTHAKGLKFGVDFTAMDNLPLRYEGAVVDPDLVYTEFDQEPIPMPGGWSTDTRLCLEANAPRPVTVMAAIVKGEVYD